MEIEIWDGTVEQAPADTRIVPGPPPETAGAPWKGERDETVVLYGSPRTVYVHPGQDPRRAMGSGVRAARAAGGRRLAVPLFGPPEALVEGALLGAYRFDRYRTRPAEPDVQTLLLAGPGGAEAQAAVARGTCLARAACLARDLTNEPGGELPPRLLAERAAEVAARARLDCRVYDERELADDLGAGAILAVGRGSAEPPRLIALRYESGVAGAPLLALVGKGVCFDAGGLQIKNYEGMLDMKTDKAGGAAVIAAMEAIAGLRPRVDVLGLVPAVENMLGGAAMKPGDVLRTLSGKTIEMKNADAEGRLILADACAFAVRAGARWIVDVATLTGACVIALGFEAAGIMGNDAGLLAAVRQAGERCGERYWELPTYPEYREQYRSEVADISNVGGRWAGAITAGMIVGEFVADRAWAHLDIAGMASTDKAGPLGPVGATGFAARTLALLAEGLGRGDAEA